MSAESLSQSYYKRSSSGFTLIELMAVVLMIGIMAAIAVPSYESYTRRAASSQAEQEILKLAEQLERHKGRNFNYRGFNANYLYMDNNRNIRSFVTSNQQIILPIGATGSSIRYNLYIRDATDGNPILTSTDAIGRAWAIKAVSTSPQNFTYLATSTGVRCKNKTAELVTYSACGTGKEDW